MNDRRVLMREPSGRIVAAPQQSTFVVIWKDKHVAFTAQFDAESVIQGGYVGPPRVIPSDGIIRQVVIGYQQVVVDGGRSANIVLSKIIDDEERDIGSLALLSTSDSVDSFTDELNIEVAAKTILRVRVESDTLSGRPVAISGLSVALMLEIEEPTIAEGGTDSNLPAS